MQAKEKATMLSAADRQMAEELDDVKKMNQMMLYAKVVTIRDAQLNEKKVIQKERLEEERRLDTIMEVERLKALKMCALTCYAKDQGQGHAHTPDLSADTLVPRPQFTIPVDVLRSQVLGT
jgi:hypothetical protein